MMDRNLSLVALEDFPGLVADALATLRQNSNHEDAWDVINAVSVQSPSVLHSYLDELFELSQHNASSRFDNFPWRESGLQHFDFLKYIVLDEVRPLGERRYAINNLMETRQTEAFALAESVCEKLDMTFRYYLEGVGYCKQGSIYKPLYTEEAYNLIFPADYREKIYPKPSSDEHPTWHLPVTDEIPQRFGGTVDSACAVCGGKLHHLITLNPIPDSLKISELSTLTLAVCLSCLGWNWETYHYLYYHHAADGQPKSIGYTGERIQPEFPTLGIEETTVQLVNTGARWRWSDWDNDYNMHRVGGFPWWIQSPDYPVCVQCQQPMRFLMQLDSGLPTPDPSMDWIWGDHGFGYSMWCDDCHVSAYLWQCT